MCPQLDLELLGAGKPTCIMWYFPRLVRMLSTQDYTLFQALYQIVYQMEDEEVGIPTLFPRRAVQGDNRQLLVTPSEDDSLADSIELLRDAHKKHEFASIAHSVKAFGQPHHTRCVLLLHFG